MSLRGRYIIDRIKTSIGRSFRLPCPPYGDPYYWDAAYRSFGPQDTYEWGDVSLAELKEYSYRSLNWESEPGPPSTSSLGDALNILPNAEMDEPILMLGCGNSKLGEEMIEAGWRGPIVQTDISARVVEAMSIRCQHFIENGDMNFVTDDATELSAFRDGMMHACLDKGLMDAIYCADEHDQCGAILSAVNRILKPKGSFVFLSFSRPEFLLPKIVDWRSTKKNHTGQQWEHIEVHELPSILLYKFQKAPEKYPQQLRPRSRKMSKNAGR